MNHTVKLRVAKRTLFNSHRIHNVLTIMAGSGLIYFERDKQFPRYDQCMFAKGVIEFIPNQPFYVMVLI